MDKFSEYIVSRNMLITKALTDRSVMNLKPAMKEVDCNRNLATLGEEIYKAYISQIMYNRVSKLSHVLLDYSDYEIIVKVIAKKYNLIEFIEVDKDAKLTKNYDFKVFDHSVYIAYALFALVGAIYLIKRIDFEEIIESFVKEIDKYYRTHQIIRPSVNKDYMESNLYLYKNLTEELINDTQKFEKEIKTLKTSKPDYEYFLVTKKRITAKSEREKQYNSHVKKSQKEFLKTGVLDFNQKGFINMINYSNKIDDYTFTYYDIELNVKGEFEPVDLIIDEAGKPYLTEVCVKNNMLDVVSTILKAYTSLKITTRPNNQKIISDYANENYKIAVLLLENNEDEYTEILNNKIILNLINELSINIFVGKLIPEQLDTSIYNVRIDSLKRL